MAAYAALVSLMHIIHQLKNHPFPPVSFDRQQVESLTENIASLQDFLERHSSPSTGKDEEPDPLEIRIAKAAYAAEDIIESHIVDAIKLSRAAAAASASHDSGEESDSGEETTSSSTSSEEEGASYIINLYDEETGTRSEETTTSSSGEDETTTTSSGEEDDSGDETTTSSCTSSLHQDLHRVIEGMRLIRKEVEEINPKKVVHHASASSSSRTPPTSQNSTMVGSEEALHEIMDLLTAADRSGCHVIPIAGMGGIGKTTLARTVYSKPLITEHFDVRIWATISHQHNVKEVLRELISQITRENKEILSGRSVDELGLELYKFLFGRRYLVVMDDMWGIDAWYSMQAFFPNNGNGSQILVTTRLVHLSFELNNNYSLRMKFLDEVSSWDLFSKTVFGEEGCPLKLMEIGKKIVENCRGLPLSIIVVGGLLRKMEDAEECWESIMENLTSRVNLENDEHCLKLLKKSYNHLPVYLKPCFLYLGVFDEDDEIDVSILIKLWVSEGFLKPKEGESLESVARVFLKDLVDRNLVLTDESWMGRTGNIKYCKVHDLLRDLCLTEGRKDGFFHVLGQESPQGLDGHRRIVIPKSASKEGIFEALQSMPRARSIISDDDDDYKVLACRKSRLLRIVNTWNQVVGRDGKPLVFRFVNLRHVTVEAHSSFLSLTSGICTH